MHYGKGKNKINVTLVAARHQEKDRMQRKKRKVS